MGKNGDKKVPILLFQVCALKPMSAISINTPLQYELRVFLYIYGNILGAQKFETYELINHVV